MSCRTRERKQSKPLLDESNDISRLPEVLLEQILFFLPLQDAIIMSSVSKAWLNAWKSFPVHDFHFNHFNGRDGVTLQEFVKSVDDSLSTLKQRRAFINIFSLNIILPSHEGNFNLNLVSERFHEWVSLIVKNYVKKIHIRVSNSKVFYTLPEALFTSRSLVKLHLQGCKFPSYTTNDDNRELRVKFLCLKELSLVNIDATEDQVQKLVNLSKSFLEKLFILNCPSLKVLKLGRFTKLSYMDVRSIHLAML